MSAATQAPNERQADLLEFIGEHVVHCKTITVAHFGRSTIRALERRGLIYQIGASFAATRAGLAELGLVAPSPPSEL